MSGKWVKSVPAPCRPRLRSEDNWVVRICIAGPSSMSPTLVSASTSYEGDSHAQSQPPLAHKLTFSCPYRPSPRKRKRRYRRQDHPVPCMKAPGNAEPNIGGTTSRPPHDDLVRLARLGLEFHNLVVIVQRRRESDLLAVAVPDQEVQVVHDGVREACGLEEGRAGISFPHWYSPTDPAPSSPTYHHPSPSRLAASMLPLKRPPQ